MSLADTPHLPEPRCHLQPHRRPPKRLDSHPSQLTDRPCTADGETFCVSSPGVGVLFGVLVTESVISKPAGRLRRKLLSLPAVLALIVRIALSTIRRIPAPPPPPDSPAGSTRPALAGRACPGRRGCSARQHCLMDGPVGTEPERRCRTPGNRQLRDSPLDQRRPCPATATPRERAFRGRAGRCRPAACMPGRPPGTWADRPPGSGPFPLYARFAWRNAESKPLAHGPFGAAWCGVGLAWKR